MQNPRPPKHPTYQSYSSRLDSYVAWPGQYVPKTPDELAAAGFFYIGSADRVTCFQCGITLRDWEEEHDPVVEHQRYSENCQFIKTVKPSDLGVLERSRTDNPSSSIEASSATAKNESNKTVAVAPVDDHDTEDTGDLDLGAGACAAPQIPIIQPQSDDVQQSADEGTCVGRCEGTGCVIKQLNDLTLQDCEQKTHVLISVQADSVSNALPDQTKGQKSKKSRSKVSSSLLAENRRLKEEAACKRCKVNMASILFLPCGHLVTCSNCAEKVQDCIMCQKTILGTVKTFRA